MARRSLKRPKLRLVRWEKAHRLIPSRYSEGGTVVAELADNADELAELVLLDGASNDRVQSEMRGGVGISTYELVYGIPNAHIVNAAYTHPSPEGARFNDNTRGAWYAADSQQASLAEVIYHKSRRLSEVVVPEAPFQKPAQDTTTYDDWLADFQAYFHVLGPAKSFPECLLPEPVPECYAASQMLAQRLLEQGSNGLVYPSVRLAGAECIACFRPALVYHPHRSDRLEITLSATAEGYSQRVRKRRIPHTG